MFRFNHWRADYLFTNFILFTVVCAATCSGRTGTHIHRLWDVSAWTALNSKRSSPPTYTGQMESLSTTPAIAYSGLTLRLLKSSAFFSVL